MALLVLLSEDVLNVIGTLSSCTLGFLHQNVLPVTSRSSQHR